MIVSLQDVEVSFGKDLIILQNITGDIHAKSRIGLIGANGAGKTTLLNTIIGDIEPEKGMVVQKPNLQYGYLKQNSGLLGRNSIYQEMLQPFSELLKAKEQLEKIQEELALVKVDSPEYHKLMERYSSLQTFFEGKEGYLIDVKIRTILNGMGFADKDPGTIIDTLSGGEKTRLALAKLLLIEPELLILDEPTNHLDFKTLTWLEEHLQSYKGAILVVSHDRYFLDKITTETWEIEFTKLRIFSGSYSKYKELKADLMARWEKEYKAQQEEIADLNDYIARNLVRASTSNSAKSRIKKLERMEVIERPAEYNKKMNLRFDFDTDPVRDVFSLVDASLSVGEGEQRKKLFDHLSFEVKRGDKVAIIGENGIGKSSLLKAIQGQLKLDSGRYRWGKEVKIAYFDQENKTLTPRNSALEELWSRFPRHTEYDVRSMLGRVLLSGEDALKPIFILSGGEKAKLSFAILMMQRGNVLILDEPTNHLDLMSKEILEEALLNFPGTVIFVSHDRYLLQRVPDHMIEIFSDHVDLYNGNYDFYLKKQEYKAILPKPEKEPVIKEEKQSGGRKTKQQKNEEAKKRAALREVEKEMEALEAEIAEMEAALQNPQEAFGDDYKKMDEHCKLLDEKKAYLEEVTDRWLELSE